MHNGLEVQYIVDYFPTFTASKDGHHYFEFEHGQFPTFTTLKYGQHYFS